MDAHVVPQAGDELRPAVVAGAHHQVPDIVVGEGPRRRRRDLQVAVHIDPLHRAVIGERQMHPGVGRRRGEGPAAGGVDRGQSVRPGARRVGFPVPKHQVVVAVQADVVDPADVARPLHPGLQGEGRQGERADVDDPVIPAAVQRQSLPEHPRCVGGVAHQGEVLAIAGTVVPGPLEGVFHHHRGGGGRGGEAEAQPEGEGGGQSGGAGQQG